MRGSCRRRSTVIASVKPTFCNSSTALIVGATASTLMATVHQSRAAIPVGCRLAGTGSATNAHRTITRLKNEFHCVLLFGAQMGRDNERPPYRQAVRIAPSPRLTAAIMLRSRSRLAAVAISRPERSNATRRFLEIQFTLQVGEPDSSPAMPQSLREQFMIQSDRYPLENVVLSILQ